MATPWEGSKYFFPLPGKSDFPDWPPRRFFPGDPRAGDPRFFVDPATVDPKVKEQHMEQMKLLKSARKKNEIYLQEMVGEFSKEEESQSEGLSHYGKLAFIYYRRRKLEEQKLKLLPRSVFVKRLEEKKKKPLKIIIGPREPRCWCFQFKGDIETLRVRIEAINMTRNVLENYFKKWIADLITGGEDPIETGRFYVEGVLVEQNMSACYALIEGFLEYIFSQLSAMHIPSECRDEFPDKFKEGVASLMYAAAKFSDLPELQNLRNIFTGKYGNSVETFVNKEFVERLMWSNDPTEDMKVELVCDIAKQFSIELDSKALEQKTFTPIPADQGQRRTGFGGFGGRCFDWGFSELDKILWSSKYKFDIKTLKVRLETIRKKRNVVQIYLKNCVVHLLMSGMDPIECETANGVLGEENMSACYALTEKFLGDVSFYIGNQSEFPDECPDICKEAVASLMYAAARFSDLPELQNLTNIFTKKYGNSLETFVNEEFVQRLSSKPPTEEMRVQLVHEIAQEFSIEWDSKALELPADHGHPSCASPTALVPN